MADRLFLDLSAEGEVQIGFQRHGEMTPSPVGDPVGLVSPFADDVLGELRWYLEDYLQAPFGVYEERGPAIAAQLQGWGEALFSAVFESGPARDAYVRMLDRDVGRELYVRSESAGLLALPWELMWDPDRPSPLVFEFDTVGRMLPTAALPQAVGLPGEGLRVLLVIARPGGLGDVGYRMIGRSLVERLGMVSGEVELEVLRPPTFEAFKTRLDAAAAAGAPFHVVHFDGHGASVAAGAAAGAGAGVAGVSTMFDAQAGDAVVLFEASGVGGDEVPAGEFARVIREGKVPVVVLNACQSGAMGESTEAAIATRVLAEGASSVVAMGYSVYVVAAAEFMTAFYDGLFSGDSVAAAVKAGRLRLSREPERPSPKGMMGLEDWMVPVHYLRDQVSFPHLVTEPPPAVAAGEGGVPSLDVMLNALRPGSGDVDVEEGRDVLAAVGRFVGRDAEFYTLEAATQYQSVILIQGPGGTGKTELAKAFGRWQLATGGVAGVVFHSFEPGVASFGVDGVITNIGMQLFEPKFALLEPDQRQAIVVEALRKYRLLLVWDNFESVYSMPDPGQATPHSTTMGAKNWSPSSTSSPAGRVSC